MKGTLIIVVLLALLVGSYLVYKNLSGRSSQPGDAGRIEEIEKARKAADQVQGIQEKIKRQADDASK